MEATKQQQLILDYEGNSVVIAAPGSGKTYVISNKIKLNLKKLLEHQGVIAISYTNKASNELRSRSLSNGENPCSSFFGTIDKFNLSEIVIPFGRQVFGIPTRDIQIIKLATMEPEQQEALAWINRWLTLENTESNQLEILKSLFIDGVILIESIGVLANLIFNNSNSCRNYLKARYKYIYIDEYQDSGSEQHDLFLKIMSLGITAIAVGDLNQSIYAFSGKDARYLEDLTVNENFKYFKLDKNHRCDTAIINYSNYLLNPKTELIETEHKPIFIKDVEGGSAEIALWIDTVIDKIKQVFKIDKNNKIGILTRFKRTAEAIDMAMKTPHHYSEGNELDTNLNIWSGIFSGLLHFIFDPNHRFIDIIELFTSYDRFSKSDLNRLIDLKETLEEMRVEPLSDIDGLIEAFIKIAYLIAPNSDNKESVKLLSSVLASPNDLRSYYQINDEHINIMTLHKSKGLEFDIVFHLDLHKWAFPASFPGENNDFKNPIYPEWKQELNLHYVGVTRARKGCFLMTSTIRMKNNGELKKGERSEFLVIDGIEHLRYTKKSE